jgi:hypothetical protein
MILLQGVLRYTAVFVSDGLQCTNIDETITTLSSFLHPYPTRLSLR